MYVTTHTGCRLVVYLIVCTTYFILLFVGTSLGMLGLFGTLERERKRDSERERAGERAE